MKRVYKTVCILSACGLLAGSAVYCMHSGETVVETSEKEQKVKTSVSAEQLLAETEEALSTGRDIQELAVSDNSELEITSSGIYRITGSASNCSISIDTSGTVILILDSVSLSNDTDAVINVIDAKHVLIYTAEGSDNTIISGTEQEIAALDSDESGAAIYSKDDLSFAGSGTLHIYGYINNGAASTNNMTVLSGTLDIKAMNNGLKGKDSLVISGGDITVLSGNDGLKSSNDEDQDMGNITITGGTFNIQSYGDCITAVTSLTIDDGDFTLSTAGYTSSAQIDNSQSFMPDDMEMPEDMEIPDGMEMPDDMELPDGMEMPEDMELPDGMEMPEDMEIPDGMEMPDGQQGGGMPGGMQGGGMQMPQGNDGFNGQFPGGDDSSASAENTSIQLMSYTATQDNTEEIGGGFGGFGGFGGNGEGNSSKSDTSQKGLKSDGTLTINGGTFTITVADDAVHANGDVTINGGNLTLSSDDDGIHSDTITAINGGTINILSSYEGIEGNKIYVTDGTIDLYSSDDGFNASGTSGCILDISGGTIQVNADGDGLDSNGDLIIEGGSIVVNGPTNSGNGALDSGSENGGVIEVSGGELIAIGASGMDETFDSSSSQCSIRAVTSSYSAGTEIQIQDESGNVLYSTASLKSFSSVVYTSDKLEENGTYYVICGSDTYTVTLSGTTGSNSSSGMSGMMGGNGMGGNGMGGNRPGGH